jgi:hypothetical protein
VRNRLAFVIAVLGTMAATADAQQPPVPAPRLTPFFNPGEPANAHVKRSIKAAFRGQKVEIEDRGGREIRMKVTRTVNGQPVSDEFQAADAEILRDQRPEFGMLYDRLAGTR